MAQTLERVLPFSKHLLEKALKPGDIAIDGTAGNGYDTLFLAELVGEDGHVYSFDVQEEAIVSTKSKLEEANINQVTLVHDGHQNVLNYVNEPISAAIFNLGYLPGSDQTVTTHGKTTWTAVTNILSLLKKNGIIILVIYHGHDEGKVERHYLEQCLETLDSKTTQVLTYQFINRKTAPFIVAIEKLH